MATEAEIIAGINFKKIGGFWGIKIDTMGFAHCKIDIKITRQDDNGYCVSRVRENLRFGQDLSGRWGVYNAFANDLEPYSSHENKVLLVGECDDNPDKNGIALLTWGINTGLTNLSSNFANDQLPKGYEDDDIKLDNSTVFYRFSKLKGRTDGGNDIDYQSNPTADGRDAPEVSSNNSSDSFPKTLTFFDNQGDDPNATLKLVDPDLSIPLQPSATRVEILTRSGELKGKDISNNSTEYIIRTLTPSTKTFHTVIHIGRGGEGSAEKISEDRDGNPFWQNKNALHIDDGCEGDGKLNTIIEIANIYNISFGDGPPPPDPPDDEPEPEPVPPPEDPVADPPPTIDTVYSGGPCPTNPPWSNGWPGNYVPNCAPIPSNDTSEESKGGLILTKSPGNPKKLRLNFGELVGAGNPIRSKLGLFDFPESRALTNKLITIRVDWSRDAVYSQNFAISGKYSDIKQGNDVNNSGSPFSRPTLTYNTGVDANGSETFTVYNIDGGSTLEFTFDSTPNDPAPTRTVYTGETVETTQSAPSGDPPVITETVTTTCIPPGGILETFSPWPPCPEEVYVTKSGGTTATAAYSDGATDGANDQFITITLLAIRESVLDSPTPSNREIGIQEELVPKIWLNSTTPASASNLNGVNGLSLADYHEHSDLIRFRNPSNSTSLTNLPAGGTAIGEFVGYSGAKKPGTMDSLISGASLPINISKL